LKMHKKKAGPKKIAIKEFITIWKDMWLPVKTYLGSLSKSERTIELYEKLLDNYVAWAASGGVLKAPDETRPETLLLWASKTGNPNTTITKVTVIRSILKYAWELGEIDTSPAIRTRTPKAQRAKRTPLSDRELSEISKTLYGSGERVTRTTLRDRALFELLVEWSPRASEICHLKWSDVDLERGEVKFYQKGKILRQFFCTESLLFALRLWRRESHSEYVFRKYKGEGSFSTQSLQMILGRWFKKAGVYREEYIGSHLFRHTLATRAFEKTDDLKKVQQLLGHKSAETTLKYIHVPQKDLTDLAGSLSKSFREIKVVNDEEAKS